MLSLLTGASKRWKKLFGQQKQENVDVPKGADSIGLNKWLLSSGEIVFIDKRLVQEDAGVF